MPALQGKRLRPVLALSFAEYGGASKALRCLCGGVIHSYSLVHDDLPCMDNSPAARRPSAHAAYGEPGAYGDAPFNRAFSDLILRTGRAAGVSALLAAFALAGGQSMVGGQYLDLQSECKSIDLYTLERLQMGKTAALIRASCEIGCHIAGADDEKLDAARTFGTQLGLCFQIVDDILDATATSEQIGKPAGSDGESGKATYVSLLGLEEATGLADKRSEMAIQALAPFGGEADGLRNLTRALQRRKK